MKPIFTPEDFPKVSPHYVDRPDYFIAVSDAVKFANAKLEKLLGPVVYHSNRYAHKVWDEVPCGPDQMGCTDTHTARLFDVQPIERAEKDTAEGL